MWFTFLSVIRVCNEDDQVVEIALSLLEPVKVTVIVALWNNDETVMNKLSYYPQTSRFLFLRILVDII